MDASINPAIKVLTLFLLITSILVVIARGTTKAVIVRSTNLDDYLIASSLVSTNRNPYCESRYSKPSLHTPKTQLFNIGQSVAVFFQTKNGYGMPSNTLSLSSLSHELKVNATTSLVQVFFI